MKKLKHDDILETIEKNLKVYKIGSCLLIYFYLMIYGKSTPYQLRFDLDVSKATLFRSLGFLLDARFVIKDEIGNSSDKRYTHYYSTAKTISEISNIELSEELKEFAKKKNKIKILEEWELTLQRAPSIYGNITSKLFELKRKTTKEKPQVKAVFISKESNETVQPPEEQTMKRGRRVKLFTLIEAPDDDLFLKLQEFLNSLKLNQDYLTKNKEKMKKAISIFIDFVEL